MLKVILLYNAPTVGEVVEVIAELDALLKRTLDRALGENFEWKMDDDSYDNTVENNESGRLRLVDASA